MAEVETMTLTATEKDAFFRELSFFLASAKARSVQVLKLCFPEAMRGEMQKKLRQLQKDGKLLCFALGDKLTEQNDATRYLLNKCPSIREDADFTAQSSNAVFLYL